jgi:hypothetical protein
MGERGGTGENHGGAVLRTPLHPGSIALRRAIRRNIVSFPAQVPVFLRQGPTGMQWRAVLLYFVLGWSSPRIAARFHVPTHRVWQVLEDWSVRAFALGYLQILDQDAFAACCAGIARQARRAKIPVELTLHREEQISHAAA